MNIERLLERIRLGEDSTLELKRVVLRPGGKVSDPHPDGLSDELAAMGNAAGGLLILGVDDKSREVVGIPPQQLDRLEAWLTAICTDRIKPPLDVVTRHLALPDQAGQPRPVIVVEVPKSLWVHQSANGYFRRVGHAKRELPPDALARLFQQRSQARLIRFEEQEVPGAALADCDPLLISRFTRDGQGEAPVQLRRLHLLKETDEGYVPTVAGALLLTLMPHRWLPNAEILAVAHEGLVNDPNDQVDARVIQGPLDRQIFDAIHFVERNMRTPARKRLGRLDYPQYDLAAVFEAIVNAVAHRDYSRDAQRIRLFMFRDRLEINTPGALPNSMTIESMAQISAPRNEVIASLTARMEAAAEALRFEAAAVYRDQIQALAQVRAVQFVESRSSRDVDVIAAVARSGVACVYLTMVRGGRSLGGRAFFPSHGEEADPPALLEAFAGQHYASHPIPSALVLEWEVEGLADWLSEQAGRRVQVVTHPQEERRVWLEMARKNAELALTTREGLRENQSNRLAALNEALAEEGIARIECFDVSHTMGEATVVSCVVFDNGAMQPSEYRRFNVANPTPGDDYAALREALSRRYGKLAEGEGKLPDLLLIDGGKGQLHVAVDVLSELGLGDLPMVGVAKGVERKAGMEQLFLPGEVEPLRLPPDHPGLHLIQQVRDEAHRFAITGHRARRGKARTQSSLEDIAGIGAKRRQKLLQTFGGLRGVIDAGVEELARVEGISRELAERIYRELH